MNSVSDVLGCTNGNKPVPMGEVQTGDDRVGRGVGTDEVTIGPEWAEEIKITHTHAATLVIISCSNRSLQQCGSRMVLLVINNSGGEQFFYCSNITGLPLQGGVSYILMESLVLHTCIKYM